MRKRRLPQEVESIVEGLPPKEKLRAWATGPELLSGGPTVVVVTQSALYAPGLIDRIEWHQILKASWSEPILEIAISEGGKTKPVRIRLDAAGSVPQLVNERVTASIIMQKHVELVGKNGASLVARRVPNSDDVAWEVVFDAGLDASDPQLREEVDQHLGWLRESVGI